MNDERETGGHIGDLFGDESAVDEFFSPPTSARPLRRTVAKPRPEHYKVISISMYVEDIERLKTMVAELKARGHTRASRSWLIREALRQIDLDAIPPQR